MADLDVISMGAAKRILSEGKADRTREDLIASAVTAMSQRLDELVGPIVKRTITEELHDGGRSHIRLRQTPALEITTVDELGAAGLVEETFDAAGDWLAVRDDDGLYSGRVLRRSGRCDTWWAAGRQSVRITYEAGRFDTTELVDARYVEAAGIMLDNWFQKYQDSPVEVGEFEHAAAAFPRFAIPTATRQILHDQLRVAIA